MSKRPLPPFLKVWFDKRTGRRYAQFRKRGHKLLPLPWPPGTDEFNLAYNAAMALTKTAAIGADLRSAPGSISAALAAYYTSHDWNGLSDGTRTKRRLILERFRERYGQGLLRQLNENFLSAYLESFKPHAARNHLKALRGFLRHAKHDVSRGIQIRASSKRHASWPAEMITQYETHHAIGTKARLAFALARYTGAACAEIARLGPPHIVDNEITIARQKTGVPATIVVNPELKAILAATTPTGLTTFLIAKNGRPYTPNSLSDQFRKWCDQAAVPAQYHLHGLRHTMGKTLAESGSSPSEIGAVLGHADARTALHYAKDAERKKLARTAMGRVIKRAPR
jgi:integrase